MPNIWQPPPGGYKDGPGLVCIGSLDTDPFNPWGRANAWAYDGAIYGYREFADPPNSTFGYSVLGGVMSVCTSDPDITWADKLAAVTDLNAGCNVNPFAGGHVLNLQADNDTSAYIQCSTDGGNLHAVVKASMAVWGVLRDTLTMNALGVDNTPTSTGYSVTGGTAQIQVDLPSLDAVNLWAGVLLPEVIALWNEH